MSADHLGWIQQLSLNLKESIDTVLMVLKAQGINPDYFRAVTDHIYVYKNTSGIGFVIESYQGCAKFIYTMSPEALQTVMAMFGAS
jgi:hypothetical protein